jgi:methylated-DNA-protein-cysteine methyltransferase related protein
MKYSEQIFNVVKLISRGRVMTYGSIAKITSVKNPRTVGRILHQNPDPDNIPCHRVVYANGRLSPGYAFGGIDVQRDKLTDEGIKIRGYKIQNISQYVFQIQRPRKR